VGFGEPSERGGGAGGGGVKTAFYLSGLRCIVDL
jgi:hypothetical protein